MTKETLEFIIEKSKQINIANINSSDEHVLEVLRTIYSFVQSLYTDYEELIEKLVSSNVRFSDYYDATIFHGEAILEYFESAYNRSDLEEIKEIFSLYVVLKNVIDLVNFEEECESMDELYELMDNDNYFEDILYNISYLEEKRLSRLDNRTMGFLNPNNKYKIYFTGLAYKDILKLGKNVKKTFINKISAHLSESDIIPLAEEVDHVKEAYNLSLFRVQFANDYRIAYVRRNGVTAILGATLKTGKDVDYTRYDHIARNKESLYEEIDEFASGKVPRNSEHDLVVGHLEDFYKKIRQ